MTRNSFASFLGFVLGAFLCYWSIIQYNTPHCIRWVRSQLKSLNQINNVSKTMDLPYLTRQPGIIKQTMSTINRKQDKHAESIRQRPTLSINLSYKNLFEFPYQFEQTQTHSIANLNVDCNSIKQCMLNTAYFPNLATLSMQYNNLTKVQIKSLHAHNSCLTHINLSHNNLQFLDLSLLPSLTQIQLCHNNLSTIILPETNLTTLDISYNAFSNIQYSVLSSKVFNKLMTINVSHNKRSLYDLILAVDDRQLLPNLRELHCGYNVISYFQHLPINLQVLNLEANQLVFDRRSVNELIRLKKLRELVLTGNTINDNFMDIIRCKKKQTKCIIKINEEQDTKYKQSPYRLYQQSPIQQNQQFSNTHKNIKVKTFESNMTKDRNFTLGEELLSNRDDEDNIDPYYYLIQETPKLHEKDQVDQQSDHKIIQEGDKENVILKETENKLKNNRFKVKIEGVRYMNHYKMYFDKLIEFMLIPPHPVPHADRNTNISLRIDPPQDVGYLNEYPLLNEMLKSRGGIHYLRKVFNWTVTQQSQGPSSQISIMFINIELSKQQFQSICTGNYDKIDEAIKNKHTLNQQPSSFSCFHILGRLFMNQTVRWSCLYLIQAVHL